MSEFNPFSKPYSEVTTEDLYSLSVPEGYYIEYKESLIDNEGIAKAVSSFANTYGGLLLFGIREDSETNEPSEWFTLGGGDPASYKETIRNAIKDYVSPAPRFTTFAYDTSSPNGGSQHILLVDVPESNETPHIHNNGRVYRRTGEGSDPYQAITDPNVFDDLYRRRRKWKSKVNEFCQRDVTVTKLQAGEGENPVDSWPMLEIYGIPTTLENTVCGEVQFDLDGFKEILEESDLHLIPKDSSEIDDESIRGGLQIHSIHGTSSGVIARTGEIYENGKKTRTHTPTTISFFSDGSAKIFLPLITIDDPSFSSAQHSMNEILGTDPNEITYIDGESLLRLLYDMLNGYMNALLEYDWPKETHSLYIKSRLVNGFRTMTFFDTDWYIDMVEDYGPPISYEDVVESPRFAQFDKEIDPDPEEQFTNIMFCIVNIFQLLGLPLEKHENIHRQFTNLVLDEAFEKQESQ